MTNEPPSTRRRTESTLRLLRPLAHQLRWVIGIRLLVITAVVLPVVLLQLQTEPATPGALGLLAVLAYGLSLLYIVLVRVLRGRLPLQFYVQFCGDLVLITALVYFFGGVLSPFSILYLVVIIAAAALFPRRVGFIVATAAWLLYAGAALSLHFGWIAPAFDGPGADSNAWRLYYSLAIHLFGFYNVALLASHLAHSVSLAETALRQKKEDLDDLRVVHRDVIESIPSGLITCDLDGVVTSANQAAQEILGKETIELLERPLSDSGLFTPELWIELTEGEPSDDRTRHEVVYYRDEMPRNIGFSVTALTNADRRRSGYIVIFQDLSDWRKLQEEVRLKDRLAAVGELASGIAHEVGNPLAAISGSVQMLSSSFDGSSSQKKLLEILLKESQRLDRTVKSFLQFARPKERSSVRFDIAQLLSENVELLRNSPEVGSGHHLEIDLDPPAASLIADPDQISQIFWNLARNALRAMPDGGALRVEGVLSGDRYLVRVIDTGRGMSDDELQTLFHPFHSFFDGGSGLGMAIVYRIVDEHGGRVSVDSEPGKGTAITVELPAIADRAPAAVEVHS